MKIYTLKQLEKELEIDLRTIRNYIKQGRLKASKIGRNYIIQETDLIEFLNNNIVEPKKIKR